MDLPGAGRGAHSRSGDWKLIEFFEDSRAELYNLAEDIGKQHDLATVHPAKVAELRTELHAWRQRSGALRPTPNPDYSPGP